MTPTITTLCSPSPGIITGMRLSSPTTTSLSSLGDLIHGFNGHNQIIHDPHRSYVRHYFDAGKGDLVVDHTDPAAVILDVFAEIAERPEVAPLLFRNMLLSLRGLNDERGMSWVNAAADLLVEAAEEIVRQIKAGELRQKEIPGEIARQFYAIKENSELKIGEMFVVEPVFDALLDAYHAGIAGNRRFVTSKDLTAARRVFLPERHEAADAMRMFNNALVAVLLHGYLAGEDRGEAVALFALGEYPSFVLDRDTEREMFVRSKEKGLCVFIGVARDEEGKMVPTLGDVM